MNEKRYWVKYTVSIEGDNTLLRQCMARKRSTRQSRLLFPCSTPSWNRVQPDAQRDNRIHLQAAGHRNDDRDRGRGQAGQTHKARAVDLAYDDVKLSDRGSSASILSFPAHIEAAIAASYAQGNRRDKIKEALMAYVGFGEARADLLLSVYVALVRRSDKTITAIDFDGSGNKRDPSAAEKASLTYVFNAWGTSITKDLNRKL